MPSIGVFDSGFGGLTVLRELLRVLPTADYLYFGDTAHLPYGAKSVRTVAKYASASAQFLEQQGAELLVIACNTASALALDEICQSVSIPVIGVIEPGAQKAQEISKAKKVAVIATEATVGSHAYQKALERRGIEGIEKGWVEHPVTEQVAHIYIDDIFKNGARGADVLVLACTHYPLIRPLLRRVAPSAVQIVDSAESTAAKVLECMDGSTRLQGSGSLRCFTTDSVEKFRALGGPFLGRPIENIELIDIEK